MHLVPSLRGLRAAVAGMRAAGLVVALASSAFAADARNDGTAVLPTATPVAAADALVAEATHAIAAGAWERAGACYAQALTLVPSHEAARAGQARVAAALAGQGDAGAVDLQSVRDQLALAQARAASERAELLARQGRVEEARQSLDIAKGALAGVAARRDLDQDVARIEQHLREIEPLLVGTAETKAGTDRTQDLATATASRRDEVQRSQSVLTERIERIHAKQRRQLFELALAEARALVLDVPGNPEAEALYAELLESVHAQRTADIDEQKKHLLNEVHRRLESSLIPTGWDGRPDYPIDWLERHQGEQQFAGQNSKLEPWEEQLVDRLAQRVTISFEDTPIDEALSAIASQGNFNLIIDPSVYANGAAPISLRVTDMRIDYVLNWLGQMTDQTWVLSKGAIYFGGAVEVERTLAVYDLAYLVRVPYDQPGKQLAFSGGGGAGGGGGGFNLFQNSDDQVVQMAPEDVVDLIRTAVSPASWDDPANAIEIRGNQIYVTAPRSIHGLLQEFIRSQSNAHSLAVHIAARWLALTDNAIEEIGINWGAAETLLAVPSGVQPGLLHTTQNQHWYGTAINRIPTTITPITPPTQGTGLNLSMLRMGNTQFSAVMHAVERKANSRVLDRPELITLNGVRGNVFFGTQHAYISDYEVVNNNLDPVIEVLNVGASLDIKPFVSADRKYVTMEFKPILASVTFFTELITAPVIVGGGGGAVIPGLAFPLELPNVRLDEVATTIIVPDGGSIMVGGFQHLIDESASSKVPFLGHIPFFGRLFGTRGRYHTREKIFLLANVRIIDYQEAEDHL